MMSRMAQFAQMALKTEAGQRLLEELEAEFCRTVFNENTNRMAYQVGQHDLVALLRSLTEEEIL